MSQAWWASAALVALTMSTSAAGAESFSNLALVDGEALPWGVGNTAIYGQTLTFTDSVQLQSLEVHLDDRGTPVTYEMSVQAWDGQAPAGPSLYANTVTSTGMDGFQSQVFDLGDMSLAPGSYVVLFEATSEATASFAAVENGYDGGAWVYWDELWHVSDTSDLGFEMTYTGN